MENNPPLENVVYFLMERTMRQAKNYTKEMLKAHGFPVTKDQWVILKRVSESDGISQVEIANTTFKDPAALTRILDLLVKKNLVERRANESDRRSFLIYLTPEGERLYQAMIPKVKEVRAKGVAGIDPKDVEILKRVLNRMYQNFED